MKAAWFLFLLAVLLGVVIVLCASCPCAAQEETAGPLDRFETIGKRIDALEAKFNGPIETFRSELTVIRDELKTVGGLRDSLAEWKNEKVELNKRMEVLESLRSQVEQFRAETNQARTERSGILSGLAELREGIKESRAEQGTLRDRMNRQDGIIETLAKRIWWSTVYICSAALLIFFVGQFFLSKLNFTK